MFLATIYEPNTRCTGQQKTQRCTTAKRRHCVSLQLLCYGMLVVSLFIAYLVGWIVSGVWVSASFQRSLDDDFATLVHAFVASRVDYCGSLPNGAPRKTTNKLQRVLNTAAHIVSNTCKFDRGLTHFRRSQLHWLDVVDRVWFRVCVQVFRCLHKMAPEYLSTYCQPISGISGRRHLQSGDCGHLDFPRVKLASYGRRSFAYAGPSNWNSLPAYLRDSSLSLISTTSKPFSSLSTRLAHAARLGFFYRKTRNINSLLLLLFSVFLYECLSRHVFPSHLPSPVPERYFFCSACPVMF